MLMRSNKAVNMVQRHIQSMMRLSSKYGKKMGTMGTNPWQSAPGSAFARKTAETMVMNPGTTQAMLNRIMNRAQGAGMSSKHMARMETLSGRVRGSMGQAQYGTPRTLQWLP